MSSQRKVMDSIKQELCSWNSSLLSQHLPHDPTQFSFWVASNLPVDNTFKLHLLEVDCVNSRLLKELHALKKVNLFYTPIELTNRGM